MEVLREERPLNGIAAEYEVHPNQISRWKAEFIKNSARAFSKETDEIEKVKQSYEKEKDELLSQIGHELREITQKYVEYYNNRRPWGFAPNPGIYRINSPKREKQPNSC